MQKKILIWLFVICTQFAVITITPAFAETKSAVPSLSDAIYADLAVRGYLDNVAVSFSDGKSADAINLNETRHWIPASTIKLFAALYAYKLLSENKISLNDFVTIDPKNVVPTELVTDEYPALSDGNTVTLQHLLFQMITQSDNTAFNTLLDVFHRQDVTNYIHSIGLSHSNVGSKLNLDTSQEQYEFDEPGYGINTITAEDYAKAFELIYSNKIPGSKDLFAILKQQKINNMLPLLLPKNVTVAHKTGDLDPLFHDGGIVMGPNRKYVVSIFSNAGDPDLIAHLSQLIYTKDYSLVGSTLQHTVGNTAPSQPLDPLVAEGKFDPSTMAVLAANTTSNLPSITASDLGITAKDLSLSNTHTLPPVIIPADSPLHILVAGWQVTKKAFAIGNSARASADIQAASLTVAEAKQEEAKGNHALAATLLSSLQQQLNTVVTNPAVASDTSIQTQIAGVSETRFGVLSQTLQQATGDDRNKLIADIASQAKQTIQNVQPNIPEATNATNPTQKPLVGEIVSTTNTSITVKTAGGQQISIPTNSVTIREKETPGQTAPSPTISETTPTTNPTPTSSLQVGTTVAIVGSSNGKTFTPSFILTNLPRQLVAPQPVTVIKVNTKNDTMVVSENGIPIQVNISNKTTIKGADTNVPLQQIKPGDVVVVNGEPLTPVTSPPTISPTTSAVSPTTPSTRTTGNSQTTNATPAISQGPTSGGKPAIGSTNKGVTNTPTTVQQTIKTTAPTTPSPSSGPSTPKVIQSTTIQVIQKAQDAPKAPTQPQPAAPVSNSKPQSAPPAKPPASTNTSAGSNTTTKNGKK